MERSLAVRLNPTRRDAGVSLAVSPSLIDERFDHDSCGVGFVASVDASPSHLILK